MGYNALLDFFPTMSMKPNQSCDDSFCRVRQTEYQKRKAEDDKRKAAEVKVEEKPVEKVHQPNKYGICIVDESEDVEEKTEVAPGIKFAYSTGDSNKQTEIDAKDETSTDPVPETEESLEDLMNKMKSL